MIVTRDDDFEHRSSLYGHPPKLIWIQLGNCRSSDILALLKGAIDTILALETDEEKSFLHLP